MNKNKYEIDMCNGSIMDKLISFALPLMLSGILQLMFNAVDIIVVGHFSSSQALAAVGSTTALINVFVNLFIGVSLGTNVLAARCYAAGKDKEMSEVVHTSILFALISGIVMAVIGVLLAKPALQLMQTPADVIDQSEKGKLPIRMIAPGRVFRSDEVDATHSPSFHQVEGLVIDKNITFADLKGTLAEFAKELFGEDTKVKFRPHHFPFTEPSAEMDVTCFKCGGKGCRMCKGSGWIEILGCGMVHPRVLEMSGINPEEYSGFAFGVGLERIALLKYEIDDMRLLYENDVRFLKQF